MWSILLLRLYLKGSRFTDRTDRGAVLWLLIVTDVIGKLASFRLRLLAFDVKVVLRAEAKNQEADPLS